MMQATAHTEEGQVRAEGHACLLHGSTASTRPMKPRLLLRASSVAEPAACLCICGYSTCGPLCAGLLAEHLQQCGLLLDIASTAIPADNQEVVLAG